MYQLAKFIQYVGILIMIWGAFRIYSRKVSVRKQLVLLVLCAVLINQAGYALELEATSLETALICIKISYVGKLMAELGIFLFVMMYCGIRITMWLRRLLLLIHFGILGLVWTCERHTLYYKNISFTQDGLWPHVVLEHGIFYNLLMILTFSYMLIMFGVSFMRFVRAESGIVRTRMLLMMVMPLSFILGLLLFISGITKGYDTTALAYVISVIFMFFALMKYDLIDEEEVAKEIIIDELGEAVFVLNNKRKLVYMNSVFESKFTDGNDLEDAVMVQEVIKDCLDDREFEYKGIYYRIQERDIIQNDQCLGHIYILHDISDMKEHLSLIRGYNTQLQDAVAQKTRHLEMVQNKLVLDMADMMESRDPSTGGHVKRTSHLVELFIKEIQKGGELQLENSFCTCLIKAAPMHDLGKIAVGDDVLKKPGRYTLEDYEKMKKHAEKGAVIVHKMLEGIGDDELARIAENVAHYHHERYDGSGYPCHLKGEEIPLEARIMAIVDVYDAMVSKRCYKDKMSFGEVDEVILKGMGSKFDPQLEPYYRRAKKAFEKYYTERAQNA